MIMVKNVIQIGNSLGVILPSDFVSKNKLKSGAKISVSHSNGSIVFSTLIPKVSELEPISDKEFLELIKDVESRYGQALDELAKLQ
jgi:antitoxin component of MazEF toxin-antitoxin module